MKSDGNSADAVGISGTLKLAGQYAGRGTELCQRTKQYALRIVRMFTRLPKSAEAQVLGRQVLRSGTSVGANYREAVRARTSAEFASKLLIALQELEETSYWLELLAESEVVAPGRLAPLHAETRELVAIFVASINTVKRRSKNR